MKRLCLMLLSTLTMGALSANHAALARAAHASDFFTTPDTKVGDAPQFAGRPQTEGWANALQNNPGDMPRLDLISAVPSITGVQRKQLSDLWYTTRKEIQPWNDQVAALQKRLKEIKAQKANPDAAPQAEAKPALKQQTESTAKISTGAEQTQDLSWIESLQTEDQVNAKIDETKQKTRDTANLLRDRMFALLSDEQKNEMIAMRHGTLIISSDARTDLPPPAPSPKKPPPEKITSAQTAPPALHNAAYKKHDMWQFLWGLR